jgi:hypothetical protein
MKNTLRRTLTSTLAVSAALAFAGCSPQLAGDPGAVGDPTTGEGRAHVMPMRQPGERTPQSAPAGAKLTYYGGPVIPNVKIVMVTWGAKTSITSEAALEGFYTGVTNSPYMDWLSEYNTSTQSIGRGTFAGAYADASPIPSTATIDDSQIQTELKRLIANGTVPAPDANTLYMFHFPPGKTITQGGSSSCSYFCAYHGTAIPASGSGYLYYGVLPDQGGGCAGGCGSDPVAFNNLTSVTSHEMIEAVTDAAVGQAASYASPLAWYDQTNGEIGDICNAQQGTVLGGNGTTYTVQLEFSNSANNCIATKGSCTPSCSGKSCGSDGCGGSCGTCPTGQTCSTAGTCTTTCTPNCAGKNCGSDGCGGSCGTCGTGQTCGTNGVCTTTGGTCAHDKCTSGTKLTSGCDACVTKICASDPFCCSSSWDSVCKGEVKSICGITC